MLGGGSVAYGLLFESGWWMKYCEGMVFNAACAARLARGPGEPSSRTIPFDSRLETDCPCRGSYVP